MRTLRYRMVLLLVVLSLGLVLPRAGTAAPAGQGQTDGTIASVEAGAVTITSRTGVPVRVLVSADTTVIQSPPTPPSSSAGPSPWRASSRMISWVSRRAGKPTGR